MPLPTKHSGGCHCGAVRFEVDLDASTGTMCNCTICTKVGSSGLTIKPSAFRLVSGSDSVGEYRVTASSPNYRIFCKRCGAKLAGLSTGDSGSSA